jgi:Zn-dependent protease with chaperone function
MSWGSTLVSEVASPPATAHGILYAPGATQGERVLLARGEGNMLVMYTESDGRAVGSYVAGTLRPSERFEHAPRRIDLPDGGLIESDDHAGLDALLAELGHGEGWVTRWQRSLRRALGALVASVIALALGYIYLLPPIAAWAAGRVPVNWLAALDEAVLRQIDGLAELKPSALPDERQGALRQRMVAIAANVPSARHERPPLRIEFRRLGSTPNAFALPGGTVVFLDGIIERAPSEDGVIGVFLHELGHVDHRHGLQNLIRSGVLTAIAAWYFGDFTLLANAASLLAELKYSRDFEREADAASIAAMRANGIDPRELAALFRALIAADSPAREDTSQGRRRLALDVPSLLSTHPDTRERIEMLERAGR